MYHQDTNEYGCASQDIHTTAAGSASKPDEIQYLKPIF